MDITKAKQVINDLILSRNENNEVVIKDQFQVECAVYVLEENFTEAEIKAMFPIIQ